MPGTVVIGGGVIGLWCAYELRRRGAAVTVVEKGPAEAACSWGNLGWITPSFSGPMPAPGVVATSMRWMMSRTGPLYIKPSAIPELAGWLWDFWRHCNTRDYAAGLAGLAALNRSTMAGYDALASDGVAFEMHRSGILFVFLTEGPMAHLLADMEIMQRAGYGRPVVLRGADLRDLEPNLSDQVIGGVLVEDERHVRPETLTAGLAARLAEMGVTVRCGAEVTGFRHARGTVRAVTTRRGEIAADSVLIAAGAWSAPLAAAAGCRLPVQAGKGYSIDIAGPSLRLGRALYLDEARVGCSPFDGLLRVGGTMELSGLNTLLDGRRIDGMSLAADRYLKNWRRGDGVSRWVGMRPVTPDGLPIIGRLPGFDNLYVATGHGMLGITLAPATAAAIGGLVGHSSDGPDLALFDPARFITRSGRRVALQ